MSPLQTDIRDAGPLDIEGEFIAFEGELDPEYAADACLSVPTPTALTKYAGCP